VLTPPLAFASSAPLGATELRDEAGPRWPRPSLLAAALELKPAPAAKGAERLGLLTIGDLLEHLLLEGQQALRAPVEPQAGLGRLDAPPRAIEELASEPLLERADLQTDGRLRHSQALRRL